MDTGRRDAAPRDRGGDRGGEGSGSGVAGSNFRSENDFGTSAYVPGDPRADEGAGESADGDGSGDGAAGAAGTGSGGPGSGAPLTGSSLDTGDTSSGQNYLLLAVLAAGGILLGITSARARSLS